MTRRQLAILAGLLALGLGALAIVSPGVIPLSLDRVIIGMIGALALVQALRVIQDRRDSDLDEAATPNPELSVSSPQPGEDLESALKQFTGTGHIFMSRNRIRDALTTAAVTVLSQYRGYTEEEAEQHVADGSWTDDTIVKAFLGDEGAPNVPIRMRIRTVFDRESSMERAVRHTVDELADVAGLHPRSRESRPGSVTSDGMGSRDGSRRSDRPVGTTIEREFDEETGNTVAREAHPTGHWRGVSLVALVGIGVGVLVEQPAVLLAGVIGIGYAGYARSMALPPGHISIDRTLETDNPDPGDEVEVTVTVTNTSGRVLPDLRIVDGVPEGLAVGHGSPRYGTALRRGESATFDYTVTARRGVHSFDPTLVIGRNLTKGVEEERLCRVENTITSLPSFERLSEPMLLQNVSTRFTGQERTPTKGEGVEFFATREYRRGDPMSRIDWRRLARSGDLTTVEFREERAATVVLLIDGRSSAYVAPEPQAPHAVDKAVDAAGRLYESLTDAGHRVGFAVAGSNSCWLEPGMGLDHRVKAQKLLGTHPALPPVPQENRATSMRWERTLRKRLSSDTQIVFLTPLSDDAATRITRNFEEYGFPVTVISPDPTVDGGSAQRLARIARQLRVSTIRKAGIPVIDWSWNDSLDIAIARSTGRLGR